MAERAAFDLAEGQHSSADVGLAVVIAVRGRLALLERTLRSIGEAVRTADGLPVEVIVLWDGADDPSAQVAAFEAATGVTSRCEHVHAGQSVKRNVGLSTTAMPVVLCVDSDVTIHPSLLGYLRQVFADDQVDAVAAPVHFPTPRGRLDAAVASMPFRQAFLWAAGSQALSWAPAATIALRVATARRLGGFESVVAGSDAGEDVDLGLRWSGLLGHPAVLPCGKLASQHARETWQGWRETLSRSWRFGWVEGPLWRRHPGFRRQVLPPLLPLGLTLAVASRLLIPTRGPAVMAVLILSGYGWWTLRSLRGAQMPWTSLPHACLLWALFDLARTLSLWRQGTATGGIWFHAEQPAGEWPRLASLSWALIGLSLSWMLYVAVGR